MLQVPEVISRTAGSVEGKSTDGHVLTAPPVRWVREQVPVFEVLTKCTFCLEMVDGGDGERMLRTVDRLSASPPVG